MSFTSRGALELADGTTPWSLAAWTKRAARLGDPAIDVEETLRHFGLHVHVVESGQRASRITLGNNHLVAEVRQAPSHVRRFWLAHELGHYLLATEAGVSFSIQAQDSRFETFCNSYASRLLLPGAWLRRQASRENQSLVVALQIAERAGTTVPSSVAALGDRCGWNSVLVHWRPRGAGDWHAASTIGDHGVDLIESTAETRWHLDRIGSSPEELALPLRIGGVRRKVRAEAIRVKGHCYSLFQRAALSS